MVNAKNAGLNTRPICSFVMWNAALIGPATSPRIAKTIAAVPIEMQLAINNFLLSISSSLRKMPGKHRHSWCDWGSRGRGSGSPESYWGCPIRYPRLNYETCLRPFACGLT